jgi:methylation protein EvaC
MPIANGFLIEERFAEEYFFNMRVGVCLSCSMVQLTELVDRERMFNENYAFFSSTSTRMASHFQALAEGLKHDRLSGANPFVVEMGSNDGIFLKHFASWNMRHLGIEPSANVAEVARGKGIRTECRFFDKAFAEEIVSSDGQADVFVGANVLCHIPYLGSVAEGLRRLLKPTGVAVFEDPYLGDILARTSYDQIYDEHAFYFSTTSLSRFFKRYGMEVIDVVAQEVHGGSMRSTIAHRGAYPISNRVTTQLAREVQMGLDVPGTLEGFRSRVEHSRDRLMEALENLRASGLRVVGYGATSKSTTVTNYCGITPNHVEFISDTTPIKQGKFSPGAHIPVRPYEAFAAAYPAVALLFAWNHSVEIMEKESAYRDAGGRWLTYVPEVTLTP